MAVPTLREFAADAVVDAIGSLVGGAAWLVHLSKWRSTAKRETDRYHHLYGRVDRNAWLLCGLECPPIEPAGVFEAA